MNKRRHIVGIDLDPINNYIKVYNAVSVEGLEEICYNDPNFSDTQ